MSRYAFLLGTNFKYNDDPHADLLAKWALRALIQLKGYKTFISNRGFNDDDILNLIGLSSLVDCIDINRRHARNILMNRLSKLEAKSDKTTADALTTNIKWLSQTLSLSAAEEQILFYSIMVTTIDELRDAMNLIKNINKQQFIKSLSIILAIPISQCKAALHSEGTLVSSGLIRMENESRSFADKLHPIDKLAETLLTEHTDKKNILNSFFNQSPTAKLNIDDFKHMSSDHHLIKSYLESVSKRKTKGVNILIHGEVGVGKTEYVRMLVQSLKLNLFEITMKDNDGDSISGSSRFSVYQLSQQLLSKNDKSVIIFDEIEDVFPSDQSDFMSLLGGGSTSRSFGKKAWINNLLENNQTPTFWLSNHIHQMDKAYLRRFDYIFEMKQPNRSGRKRIINKYLGDKDIDSQWIDGLANNENIAPAFIEKAAKVIEHMSTHEKDVEHTLDKVIGNTLEIMGHKNKKHTAHESGIPYSIDNLNTDSDILELCEGLKEYGNARLCFYGKSGTGKTNLGHHIADYIDKPLIVKKGSDIISMWVGGTEKNIADMFRQATDDNAILLLDEADSFIQDRKNAQRSWEITQVNELLTQMEDFDGVFIASTNLLDILDSASLRRFDFKVKFDYMKHNSAINLFNKIIGNHNWRNTLTDLEIEQRLLSISNLALGDFNVAVRKMRFSKDKSSTVFINHLISEVNIKQDNDNVEMGFAANIH